LTAPSQEAAPDNRKGTARIHARGPSRRWVLLSVLTALAFVSGVGASQDQGREGEVIASFDPVPIEALPLHGAAPARPAAVEATPAAQLPPVSMPGPGLDPLEEIAFDEPAELIVVTKGELAEGQSLGSELAKRGIAPSVVHLIAQEIRPYFDFRHSRPGHRYRLALNSDGNIVDFRYSTSLEESIYLYWDGEAYAVREDFAELNARVVTLAGIVETSLYNAVRALGEDPQLADDFAEIFAWDIDFTRNVKAGDTFRVLYERLYLTDDDGEEVYIRPGRILAAHYEGGVGEHSAVYFEPEEGRGSYFRPDGTSVERAFLVAPLRYSRISSTFTNARRHPILNVTRRHPGIDYAASEGTPLWSVADGTVIFRGRAGASGNLVKIRHANGYVSHYAHLSRFAEGLSVGQRVGQKEVIGYVGHTGLATGSHVCFRVTKNGRYVNPMAIRSPAAEPVERGHTAEFAQTRDHLLAALDIHTMAASDEAL
jgi:murein DD-endopeptidase MepM/ murein hydrolase activator NlpD